MEFNYLDIANSPALFILCLIPIVFAIIQSSLFIRLGCKEAKNMEFPQGTVKKVVANSAIFSIITSLPIIITLAVLMGVLGKYVPWLRLSVIGSAAYEGFAADLTIKGFGLSGLGEASLTPEIFVSAVYVMSWTVLLASPVLCVVFLKRYDNKLKSMKKSSGFLAIGTGAMFIGMLSVLFVPELLDFENPNGIVAAIVAGASGLLFDYIRKRTGKKLFSDFAFPLSMVLGMSAALIVNML